MKYLILLTLLISCTPSIEDGLSIHDQLIEFDCYEEIKNKFGEVIEIGVVPTDLCLSIAYGDGPKGGY